MARKSPVKDSLTLAMPEQDKHQTMLSDMHDALYGLGSKINKPFIGKGESKLLPKSLQPKDSAEAKLARAHIEALHCSMKALKGGK